MLFHHLFMPNKLEKFGIKFRVPSEVSSKYAYNILPYLGAVKKRNEMADLLPKCCNETYK